MPSKKFYAPLDRYLRRPSREVAVGNVVLGGPAPVVAQSMTNCDTNDTAACASQIARIVSAGGRIVRLTTQGRREAENLAAIRNTLDANGVEVSLVADVHFNPAVAMVAAGHTDKVRINPGNYRDSGGEFRALIEKCRERGVALRIGVNHGSLSPRIVERWGDTPEGMVASAMEFLEMCRLAGFHDVVVSMKSSNVRVMVHSVRLLVAEMERQGMNYPLHLGVTEAGDGEQGRVKSAVGIGALLADGIGDTIRVSLTEDPEYEIPVANLLIDYVAARSGHSTIDPVADDSLYSPFSYRRRLNLAVGRIGGDQVPLLYSELNDEELRDIEEGDIAVVDSTSGNPPAEWRARILNMTSGCDHRPVILRRSYNEDSLEALQVKASADFGLPLLDGLADGIWIENRGTISAGDITSLSLAILQAARVRISRTEYIACPGCGRTLYNLQETLATVRSLTSHLKGLKIGVMGCIVNGPGEMADADYGYVGAGPGRITLYRGREAVKQNIPQDEAPQELVNLIKADNRWTDPMTR